MSDHRTVQAIDALAGTGVEYADARLQRTEYLGLALVDGDLTFNTLGGAKGLGVRVLLDGVWGFASGNANEPREVAERALDVARAMKPLQRGHRVELAPRNGSPPGDIAYRTNVLMNPFAMTRHSLEAHLRVIDDAMHEPFVDSRLAFFQFNRVWKHFASTDGIRTEQEFFYTDAHAGVGCTHKGERLERTYEGFALVAQGGFEIIDGWKMEENAHRIAKELGQLRYAPPCPQGKKDILLSPAQLFLQTHETGHGFKVDRILKYERALAGTSFLSLDEIGTFRFGSPYVTITADATKPSLAGTFGMDDDGEPAQAITLVDRGIFTNVLSSREHAWEARHQLPPYAQRSAGAARAEDDSHKPLERMTNVCVETGDIPVADLIKGIEEGILFGTNRTWSIDDKRCQFRFGSEIGWYIKDGEVRHPVRSPTYQGDTRSFWHTCDGVSREWELLGVSNCGKGQPGQSMYCGHESPYARFRDVDVGVVAPVHSSAGAGSCAHHLPGRRLGITRRA